MSLETEWIDGRKAKAWDVLRANIEVGIDHFARTGNTDAEAEWRKRLKFMDETLDMLLDNNSDTRKP